MRTLRQWTIVFLASALCHPAWTQSIKRPAPKPDPWAVQASTFTADSLKESEDLQPVERAGVLAQLAKLWSRADIRLAEKYAEETITLLDPPPFTEKEDDRARRLAATRNAQQLIVTFDPSVARKLDKSLKDVSRGPERNPGTDGDVQLRAVWEIIGTDPSAAAKLAIQGIKAGGTYNVSGVLLNLCRRNLATLCDSVFQAALVRASNDTDPQFLIRLVNAVETTPESAAPHLSAEQKQRLAAVFSERVLRVPVDTADKSQVCSLATNINPPYSLLPPEQAAALSQVVSLCPGARPSETADASSASIAELIRKADEQSDIDKRSSYRSLASQEAERRNDPESVLEVLRSYTLAEKEKTPMWEAMYYNRAGAMAAAYMKAGDRDALQQLVNTTPDELKGAVLSYAAAAAFKMNHRDEGLALLLDAQRFAEKADRAKSDTYWLLMDIYAKYVPEDAIYIFRMWAKAIVEHPQDRSPETSTLRDLSPYDLPPVFKSDPDLARAIIRDIPDRAERIRVLLAFVKISLASYSESHNRSKHR